MAHPSARELDSGIRNPAGSRKDFRARPNHAASEPPDVRSVPTLQASHFGRIDAVYGGFFVVLSLLWGWGIDGDRPDRADVTGAFVALAGVCVMMYWPRT